MIDIWSGTDFHEELITINTRSYMHAQLVQYNNTVYRYLKKIKNVIFLTKLHRKINKTGEEQVIFFFLSEFWLLTTRLVSYNMVQIITCVMTIYQLLIISVGQNLFSFRFSPSLKIQSSSLKLALISISRMYIVIKFTGNKIPQK